MELLSSAVEELQFKVVFGGGGGGGAWVKLIVMTRINKRHGIMTRIWQVIVLLTMKASFILI